MSKLIFLINFIVFVYNVFGIDENIVDRYLNIENTNLAMEDLDRGKKDKGKAPEETLLQTEEHLNKQDSKVKVINFGYINRRLDYIGRKLDHIDFRMEEYKAFRKQQSKDRASRVIWLYCEENMAIDEISRLERVSIPTVYKYLRDSKVKLRSRKKADNQSSCKERKKPKKKLYRERKLEEDVDLRGCNNLDVSKVNFVRADNVSQRKIDKEIAKEIEKWNNRFLIEYESERQLQNQMLLKKLLWQKRHERVMALQNKKIKDRRLTENRSILRHKREVENAEKMYKRMKLTAERRDKKKLAAYLYLYRRMSIKDIALKLNISPTTVSNYLHGQGVKRYWFEIDDLYSNQKSMTKENVKTAKSQTNDKEGNSDDINQYSLQDLYKQLDDLLKSLRENMQNSPTNNEFTDDDKDNNLNDQLNNQIISQQSNQIPLNDQTGQLVEQYSGMMNQGYEYYDPCYNYPNNYSNFYNCPGYYNGYSNFNPDPVPNPNATPNPFYSSYSIDITPVQNYPNQGTVIPDFTNFASTSTSTRTNMPVFPSYRMP